MLNEYKESRRQSSQKFRIKKFSKNSKTRPLIEKVYSKKLVMAVASVSDFTLYWTVYHNRMQSILIKISFATSLVQLSIELLKLYGYVS